MENARIIVLTTFDGDKISTAPFKPRERLPPQDAPAEALMDCIRRVHAGRNLCPVHLAAKRRSASRCETLMRARNRSPQADGAGKSNKEIGSAPLLVKAQ